MFRGHARTERKKIILTMIHGTWAGGSPSIMSKLSEHVCSHFDMEDVIIREFRWSGLNRFSARERAVIELRNQISQVSSEFPSAAHYLIAHSHGGNIAMLALKEEAVSKCISGVVCLATPFLHISKRRSLLGSKLVDNSIGLLFGLLCVGSIGLAGYLYIIDKSVAAMIVLMIGLIAFVYGVSKLSSRAPTLHRLLQLHGLPESIKCDALLVRSTEDEASDALTFVHVYSRLIYFTYAYPQELLFKAPIFLLVKLNMLADLKLPVVKINLRVVLLLLSFGSFLFENVEFGVLLAMLALASTSVGIALLMVIILLAIVIIYLPVAAILSILLIPLGVAFGPDVCFLAAYLNVSAEDTPPGEWRVLRLVDVINDQETAAGDVGDGEVDDDWYFHDGLKHSKIYDDIRVHKAVCEFISGGPN